MGKPKRLPPGDRDIPDEDTTHTPENNDVENNFEFVKRTLFTLPIFKSRMFTIINSKMLNRFPVLLDFDLE